MKNSIDRFAHSQASKLGKKVAKQIRRAVKRQDEDTIHDLRVAIRRFSSCLRVFRQFFPRQKTSKTLKGLSRLLHRAADVRNRDIAIELIGMSQANLVAALQREREQASRKLARALERWRSDELN
jgi:CHAD domain-containing protein